MNKLTKDKKILIVGLGLIGGSYAQALTDKGYHVEALARRQETIDYALKNNLIKNGYTTPSKEAVGDADIVVFALYPHTFIEWIKEYQSYFKSGAIITDVTGVKCSIVYEIQNILRPDVEFISAHPMAGREVYGVENHDKTMFHGANYIVVPTSKNTEEAIELCKNLGEELEFNRVSTLSPEEHDEMIGFLSQLTHVIAVSLMTCKENCEGLVAYTGDSFRDLTRIAKINDDMWSELFLQNRNALLREMAIFRREFDKMEICLLNNDRDGLRDLMKLSTKRRTLFDKPKTKKKK